MKKKTANAIRDLTRQVQWLDGPIVEAIGHFYALDVIECYMVQGRYAGKYVCERGRTVADVLVLLDHRRTCIIADLFAEACEAFPLPGGAGFTHPAPPIGDDEWNISID